MTQAGEKTLSRKENYNPKKFLKLPALADNLLKVVFKLRSANGFQSCLRHCSSANSPFILEHALPQDLVFKT